MFFFYWSRLKHILPDFLLFRIQGLRTSKCPPRFAKGERERERERERDRRERKEKERENSCVLN